MLPRLAALCAIGLGLVACGPALPAKLSDAELIQRATAMLLATKDVPPATKVIAAGVEPVLQRVCGWADFGPPEGIMPFVVDRDVVSGETEPPSFWPLHEGSRADRIAAVFYRALDKNACMGALPPPPKGAVIDADTEARLSALWLENGSKWAVFKAPDEAGWVGVARRRGGGVNITPTFASQQAVRDWIASEGEALAAKSDAEGKAGELALGECFKRAKDDKARDACSSPDMDRIVELKPATTP